MGRRDKSNIQPTGTGRRTTRRTANSVTLSEPETDNPAANHVSITNGIGQIFSL